MSMIKMAANVTYNIQLVRSEDFINYLWNINAEKNNLKFFNLTQKLTHTLNVSAHFS